jgi:hypothetical protein
MIGLDQDITGALTDPVPHQGIHGVIAVFLYLYSLAQQLAIPSGQGS